MSSSKNLNARERARVEAEQAAARRRDQRILLSVVVAFVVLVVAGGILFQAWRTHRSPSDQDRPGQPVRQRESLAHARALSNHRVAGNGLPRYCSNQWGKKSGKAPRRACPGPTRHKSLVMPPALLYAQKPLGGSYHWSAVA